MNPQLSTGGVKPSAAVTLRDGNSSCAGGKQRGEEEGADNFDCQGTRKFPMIIHTQKERSPLGVKNFIGRSGNNS